MSNWFLASLPEADYRCLKKYLEPIELNHRQLLYSAEKDYTHAYLEERSCECYRLIANECSRLLELPPF